MSKKAKGTEQLPVEITENGFRLGLAEIERIPTEDESGAVLLGLKTPDISLQILVTRVGMVRLFVPPGGMVMVEADNE